MRTTLTLDDDLAQQLKELARGSDRSFKEITNEAIGHAKSWLDRNQTQIVAPGPRHLEILSDLMEASRASGRLTTDAHLAALAIETQSVIHSNDADFSRFPGLRWKNPLR